MLIFGANMFQTMGSWPQPWISKFLAHEARVLTKKDGIYYRKLTVSFLYWDILGLIWFTWEFGIWYSHFFSEHPNLIGNVSDVFFSKMTVSCLSFRVCQVLLESKSGGQPRWESGESGYPWQKCGLENGWDPGRRAVGRRKSIELVKTPAVKPCII